MDLQAFFNENKEIFLVVLGGLFSVVAAFIKSKGKPNPRLLWFLAALMCGLVGCGLLVLEYSRYPFDPNAELSPNNTGALLALSGCLLAATGGIWGVIHFVRLFATTSDPVLADQPPSKKK